MSRTRALPLLRHTGTGAPLPWLDLRLVPQQTMMEYVGVDRSGWATLISTGALILTDGVVMRGVSKPQASYIPAVIYSANGWSPSPAVMAVLAAGDALIRDQIAAKERELAELRSIADGSAYRGPRRTAPAAIPFPAASKAALAR